MMKSMLAGHIILLFDPDCLDANDINCIVSVVAIRLFWSVVLTQNFRSVSSRTVLVSMQCSRTVVPLVKW